MALPWLLFGADADSVALMKAQFARLGSAAPPAVPRGKKVDPADVYTRIRSTCATRGLKYALAVLAVAAFTPSPPSRPSTPCLFTPSAAVALLCRRF